MSEYRALAFLGVDCRTIEGYSQCRNSGQRATSALVRHIGNSANTNVAGASIGNPPKDAAAAAGFKPLMSSSEIDGVKITARNSTTAESSHDQLSKYKPGDTVKISILNSAGQSQTATVKLVASPQSP